MVYVFLAHGFEEIEALTVVDLLRRAEVQVKSVSVMDEKLVYGAHGIGVEADILLKAADFKNCGMLVFPGGMPGTLNLGANKYVLQTIIDFNVKGKLVSAICALIAEYGGFAALLAFIKRMFK